MSRDVVLIDELFIWQQHPIRFGSEPEPDGHLYASGVINDHFYALSRNRRRKHVYDILLLFGEDGEPLLSLFFGHQLSVVLEYDVFRVPRFQCNLMGVLNLS